MEKGLAYRRTHKAILNAFITISPKLSFEKMTVQNIIDEALVSRFTFYQHFHDKYDVAEQLQNNLYQSFIDLLSNKIPELDLPNQSPNLFHQKVDNATFEFIRQNSSVITALKHIHTDTIDFERLLKTYFVDHYLSSHYISSQDTSSQRKLEAHIYGNMITAAMEIYTIDPLSSGIKEISQNISSAYINAFAYAMGIHEKEAVKKLTAFIQKLYPSNS